MVRNTVTTWVCLVSLLLFSVMQAVGGDDTNLYYRVFAYGGSISRVDPFAPPDSMDMKAELSSKAKDITWPPGSMAVMVWDDTEYLIVRNTHQNLRRISDATWKKRTGYRIAVESTVLAFRRRDIEELQNGKGVSKNALFELRRKGRAELISTARGTSLPGYEVTVRNTREHSYPDEKQAESVTNRFAGNDCVILPDRFTSCETGLTLAAVSDLDDDGFIGLMVRSEWTDLEKWERHEVVVSSREGFKSTSVRMPVLFSSTVETQLRLKSGETVLVGGGNATSKDMILYHFLKAEVIPPEDVQKPIDGSLGTMIRH